MPQFKHVLIAVINFVLISANDSYYQLIENFSFNLKDKKDREKVYRNYIREGNMTINDAFISLTNEMEDSSGLMFTKEELVSTEMEMQVWFQLNNKDAPYLGSVLAIWLFKENDTQSNAELNIGFKVTLT